MSSPSQRPGPFFTPPNTTVVGSRILVYDEVDSTNDCALRVGGHGTVLVAERQTAGRGRHGRPWHSPPGLGLWFSVAFEDPIEGLVFAAPLAVCDALRTYCEPKGKWPNDIYLGHKKVCGILLEHRRNRTALGIGVNVSHRLDDFPPDLRDAATSIELVTGAPCDRGELLRGILTRLDESVMLLKSGPPDEFRQRWVAVCGILGRSIRSGDTEGTVTAVDDHGALLVTGRHGTQRVVFGEVIQTDGD